MNIEKIKSQRILYLRRKGEYGVENIYLMEKLKGMVFNNTNYDNCQYIYGIVWNSTDTLTSKQVYDVGVIVNDEHENNDELNDMILHGGHYAVFKIEHTSEAINDFWNNFSKLTSFLIIDDSRPILERYNKKEVINYCELCIPIKETI